MTRLLPILLTALLSLPAAARQNSPLIQDYRNQRSIQSEELARLKVFYTHSSLEVNGDYLFVPIVSNECMVTEQYLLYLLDMLQISYTNTINTLLARRTEVMSRLVGDTPT